MIGRVIGHFEVREKIGAGAMGEVYLAWDRHLRRKVALKFLPPSTIANVVARQRLRREALALSKLNHPAIATLFDFLSDDAHDCLVMEYVEGESLDRALRGAGLDEDTLLRYAAQIADGLAAAHEAGVLHRDLKPANIRVTAQGRVKLLDFGLAKQLAHSTSATATATALSSTGGHGDGELVGTMAYIAPELWSGAAFGPSADLYSFGVVLFELATGRRPFEGLTGSALVHAIKEESPGSARTQVPGLSPELDAVIGRLMAKHPEERFSSAREVHETLDALYAARRSSSREPGSPLPPGRGADRRVLVAALASVAIVAAIVLGVRLRDPSGRGEVVVGVQPLNELTSDPGSTYFADGVTHELTSRLAGYEPVRVISPGTMVLYRLGSRPAREIARAVGADRLVQGSLRREGDRVRFSVEVVNGANDRILWSRAYDGGMAEIVLLEERIARDLAVALAGAATPAAGSSAGAARVDPVAYDLYLRGRYELDRRHADAILRARAHFQDALARDSTFAPAWAGLADSWSAAGFTGVEPPDAAFPHARVAAHRAIAIDPGLSDGHVSLANVLQNHDRDWDGAERELKQALALNPSNAVAHHWYATQLAERGAFEAALPEIRRARALDPASLPIAAGTAAILYFARRYDEALDSLDVVVPMDSTSSMVQRARAAILDRLGREDEAVEAIRMWLEGQKLHLLAEAVGQGYAAGGMPGAITVMIEGLKRKRAAGLYEPATHIAELYARLGDREEAIRWLQLAAREHDTELNRLKVDPIFDSVRDDPRFAELVARVGLKKE